MADQRVTESLPFKLDMAQAEKTLKDYSAEVHWLEIVLGYNGTKQANQAPASLKDFLLQVYRDRSFDIQAIQEALNGLTIYPKYDKPETL